MDPALVGAKEIGTGVEMSTLGLTGSKITPCRRESGPDALAYRFKLGSEEHFYLLHFF